MALCKNCKAKDLWQYGEFYECGPGCPDQDFDVFGGDCIQPLTTDALEDPEEEKFAEQYKSLEVKAELNAGK